MIFSLLLLVCFSFSNAQNYYLVSLAIGIPDTNVTVDYCTTNTHACQATCVNGTYPERGYTCKKPDGTLLEIDGATHRLFEYAKIALENSTIRISQDLTNIQDVRVDLTNGVLSYVFGVSGTLTNTDQLVVAFIPPVIVSNFKTQFSYTLSQSRIKARTTSGNTAIEFTFYLPASRSVTWTSLNEGSVLALRVALFEILGINMSIPANNLQLVNGYFQNNHTVFVTFIEDVALDQNHDPNINTRSCFLAEALLYNSTVQAQVIETGYSFDNYTSITTNTKCFQPSPNIVPEPKHIPQPANSASRWLGWMWVSVVVLCLLLSVDK